MNVHRTLGFTAPLLLLCCMVSVARAQRPKIDLALTYVAVDSIQQNSNQKFWLEGGSAQLGFNLFKGLGFAADLTGAHTNSIAASGVPLSLIVGTAGPRYRVGSRNVSVYVQALFGEANGFRSQFPSGSGLQTSATAFALQAGGGVDLRLSPHVAVRAVDAALLRTSLPNSTTNVQNNLRIGAGVVFRF